MKRIFSKHVFMRASVMMLMTMLTSMTTWATTENLGGYDFTVGTDTDGEYYVIDGTAALNALASYVNNGNNCSGKRFKMTDDITYDKTVVNNYTPIGNNSNLFRGIFDGQGHTISGINIDTFSSSSHYAPYQAVFGCLYGTVRNLVVNNCSIFGYSSVGAIAGTLQGSTIENCHVGNDVTLNAHSYVGGIAGSNGSGTIKGCTCAATITGRSSSGWGASRLGGITGSTSGSSKLTDNIFTGIISNLLQDYIGAIVGENQNGTLTNNVYTFTVLRGVGAADSATGTDESGASLARSITAGTNLTLDFAGSAATVYSPNGISVYAAGMKYANTLYVGSTATVSLLLSYSSTPLTGYLATTGTFSGSAVTGTNDAYTLTMAGTDAVIYADGSLSYYVHFNANGGTGTMDNEAFFSDPKALTINAFTRTGYTFAGWATTENGDVAYTDRQSVSNLTTTAGATVELYAKWTPIQYILYFAKNGGQGDDSDRQRIYYDEDQNLHLCPYTRTGYTFAGWATTADGDVVYTDGQSVRNVSTIPGSIKVTPLYAKWTPITYTVTFNANGGQGVQMANQNFTYDVAKNLSACTYTPNSGFTFDGWATTADGDVAYTDGQEVSNLTTTAGGTVTLFARWKGTANLGGYNFTFISNTEGGYYVIDGTAALNALASYVNAGSGCSGKRFKMTAPITYDGTANNYTPIGDNTTSTHWFCGTFDGQGHTISGININNSSAHHQGIFGFVDVNGTVKNLVVSNCSIVVHHTLGAIAGQIRGTIENCSVGSDVTLSGNLCIGGIAGVSGEGTIKGCTCAATITGTEHGGESAAHLGGIVGETSTGSTSNLIDNCFTGAISGSLSKYIGAIVGNNKNGSLTNNVHTSTVLGGIGADGSTTGADGAGAAKAYELTAAPALLGDATFDYGTVKAYGNYGLGYNSKYYLALIPLSETEGMTYLTTNLATETAVPVEFKRTFSNGVASTVCLPFGYTPGAEGTYYTFSGVNQDTYGRWTATMSANTAATLSANTPYLFVPAADGVVTPSGTCNASSATAGSESPSGGDWSFVGTYAAKTWTSDASDYGFAAQNGTDANDNTKAVNAGDFVHLAAGASIKPFRAYLRFTGSTLPWASSSARRMTRGDDVVLPQTISVVLVSANGDTTEIGTLDTRTGEIISTGDWYSLDGRRLQGKPSTKGVYVNNGKKIVVK